MSASVIVDNGGDSGFVMEDVRVTNGNLSAFGILRVSNDDPSLERFVEQAAIPGSYGTFTLDSYGLWTYTADDSQTAIQQLSGSQSITDSFTAVSIDGTASRLVTVTIVGWDDAPVLGGATTGSVTEDVGVSNGNLRTSGTLTISDADQGQSSFVPQASTAGLYGYGTFTLAADGTWTYTADNSQSRIQQLAAGQSLTDSFYGFSYDGSRAETVTVTINGTNDVAVISGQTTATMQLRPDGSGTTTAGGLQITDADAFQARFAEQPGTVGAYGTFTLGANGVWRYTVDSDLPAVRALGATQSLHDSFTAVSSDGTASQLVTVTIEGTDHRPIANGDSYSTVENTALTVGSPGVLGNDSDPDGDAMTALLVTGPSHGLVSLNSNGSFTYTPNSDYVGTDSFTYEVHDGMLFSLSPATVSLTVNSAPTRRTRDDFNGDSHADIVWRNMGNGDTYLWNSNAATGGFTDQHLGVVPLQWSIQETADFNGDGHADILWRNTSTGDAYLWDTNPGAPTFTERDLGIVPTDWAIQGAADFNGDNRADLLWRNIGTGDTYLWNSNAATGGFTDQHVGVVPLQWSIQETADFNGDGHADILWRNTSTGDAYLWDTNPGAPTFTERDLGIVPTDWRITA